VILNVTSERRKNFLLVMIMAFLFSAVSATLLLRMHREAPEERIVRILDSLKKKIGFTEDIKVLILILHVAQPDDTSRISRPDRKPPKLIAGAVWNAIDKVFLIGIDKRIANRFSEEALSCLLAHELGHIVLGHLKSDTHMSLGEEPRKQVEADAFSFALVSEEACRATMISFGFTPEKIEELIKRAKAVSLPDSIFRNMNK